jgi:hypothetical protein
VEPGEGQNTPGIVPARALESIAVSEVIDALESGEGSEPIPKEAMKGPLKEVLDSVDSARAAALKGITIKDLLEPGGE